MDFHVQRAVLSPHSEVLVFLTGQEEIESMQRILERCRTVMPSSCLDLQVCTLFAALPTEQQKAVFTWTKKVWRLEWTALCAGRGVLYVCILPSDLLLQLSLPVHTAHMHSHYNYTLQLPCQPHTCHSCQAKRYTMHFTFQVDEMDTVHTLSVIHCTLQTVYCISFYSTLHYTLLLLYAYKLLVQIKD